MQLFKTEDYHEDYGSSLFFSFSYDEDGHILGEPPEVMFADGYLSDDFDGEKWTHFVRASEFNTIFEQADPVSFPNDSANEQNEALLSSFGDGWYEGFLKAKHLSERGEDLDEYDALSMSEDSEHIAKVGIRNKELLERIKKLEATLLTVRSERDIYKAQADSIQKHLDELQK